MQKSTVMKNIVVMKGGGEGYLICERHLGNSVESEKGTSKREMK